MIITIARQSGCSGKQVGQLLAEHYHIPLYDKDALIDMAQKTGLYESIPNFFSCLPSSLISKQTIRLFSSTLVLWLNTFSDPFT